MMIAGVYGSGSSREILGGLAFTGYEALGSPQSTITAVFFIQHTLDPVYTPFQRPRHTNPATRAADQFTWNIDTESDGVSGMHIPLSFFGPMVVSADQLPPRHRRLFDSGPVGSRGTYAA